MSTGYGARVTRLVVGPKGSPICEDNVTIVEIDDEGAGEYLVVRQNSDETSPVLKFDCGAEWEAIRAAIDQLNSECR